MATCDQCNKSLPFNDNDEYVYKSFGGNKFCDSSCMTSYWASLKAYPQENKADATTQNNSNLATRATDFKIAFDRIAGKQAADLQSQIERQVKQKRDDSRLAMAAGQMKSLLRILESASAMMADVTESLGSS
jgi:hypothetical protein